MSVAFNHTIVWCHDQQKSASFLAEILGRAAPGSFGPFLVVEFDNGASLDFYETEGKISMQHYAFLIGEDDFDAVFARLDAKGMSYWADPGRQKPGEIYRHNGGRGFYFMDPDGHLLEVLTKPYGSAG
jgi:catechol 2,3-dioxygenase-like lactoylglutathione lyase family enzyme